MSSKREMPSFFGSSKSTPQATDNGLRRRRPQETENVNDNNQQSFFGQSTASPSEDQQVVDWQQNVNKPQSFVEDAPPEFDLPPATSLMDMSIEPANRQPQRSAPLQQSQPNRQETLLRGGADLGARRGFGFAVDGSSNPTPSVTSDLGQDHSVTAAVELVSVNSPWVTVFGFPAGGGAAVLRHFQNLGEVHQHKSEPGNWMHILYGSKVQASRALAQNGHFIRVGNEDVMIGVKSCSETSLGSAGASRKHSKRPYGSVERYRIDQPQEIQHAPRRVSSVCNRICSWILDW